MKNILLFLMILISLSACAKRLSYQEKLAIRKEVVMKKTIVDNWHFKQK